MKMFILKWNPIISSVTMERMHEEMEDCAGDFNSSFDWSVFEWEKVKKVDRVFMLLVGQKEINGIVGAGWFSSDSYQGEYWAGTDRKRHFARIV